MCQTNFSINVFLLYFSYSHALGRDVAIRKQLPLKLSFAMTIHKSQGMTLENVEVFCNGIFAPGQLAVAIGRAKSVDGLAVHGFDPVIHVVPQPAHLLTSLKDQGMDVNVDFSCCNAKKESKSV